MTSLNPLHTIERQIGESLALHQGLTGEAARARILELLQKVGIREAESRLGAYPHQLSGGQRQRVMIAMALANGPELLIADEPTTALDVTIQAQILDLLAELKATEGLSLLFITHDLGIVRRIADRVCVMQGGEIVEQGPAAEIFANPQHPYTQKLLAAEPKGRPEPCPRMRPRWCGPSTCASGSRSTEGLLRRTVGHVKAVNDASCQRARGRDAGDRGRKRVGQDHAGAGDPAADPLDRAGRVPGRGPAAQARARRCATCGATCRSCSRTPTAACRPRMTVEQIIAEGLGVHRLEPGRDKRRDGGRDHDRGRPRPGGDGALPARILGRPAAAHGDRAGDDPAAQAGGAGRADECAGHDGAGADRRASARRCSASGGWPTCSSATTCGWCGRWRTR